MPMQLLDWRCCLSRLTDPRILQLITEALLEKREGHRDENRFHFDFRFRVDGLDVYVETVLRESRNEATIAIVNMHLK